MNYDSLPPPSPHPTYFNFLDVSMAKVSLVPGTECLPSLDTSQPEAVAQGHKVIIKQAVIRILYFILIFFDARR